MQTRRVSDGGAAKKLPGPPGKKRAGGPLLGLAGCAPRGPLLREQASALELFDQLVLRCRELFQTWDIRWDIVYCLPQGSGHGVGEAVPVLILAVDSG
jgi:hypothetical protein